MLHSRPVGRQFLEKNRYNKSFTNKKYKWGEMFKDIILKTIFSIADGVWGSSDCPAFHLKYLTFMRICLLMQGTRVRALVWEDPTCHGAAGPVSHNC